MRPPTPEWTPVGTPAPVGTPTQGIIQTNPQFQPTPTVSPQLQPDATPAPTPYPQPQPQPDPGDARPDPQPNDKCRDDNCTREEMERRIGTSTVASEIVGNPNFYPNQDSVDRPYIVDIAVNMCKNGYNPAFPIEYWQFADRNVLIEGHHRFIASYVARVTPIFKGDDVRPIESPPHSRREWSQVRIR